MAKKWSRLTSKNRAKGGAEGLLGQFCRVCKDYQLNNALNILAIRNTINA